jgi:hypothetical protein
MTRKKSLSPRQCLDRIRDILRSARRHAFQAINKAMIIAYWHIGWEIVEEEQRGKKRADYGTSLLKELSRNLSSEFGRGYSEQNLRLIRQFYLTYQDRRPNIRYSLSSELSSLSSQNEIHHSLSDDSYTAPIYPFRPDQN